MSYDSKKIAGLLFIVGVVQYVLAIIISESVSSSVSVKGQTVSDLGNWGLLGNNAAIFNVSAILYGLFVIEGAFYIQRVFKNRIFASLMAINGVASAVAGVVTLDISSSVHSLLGLVAFVTIAASAIMSYKFEKSPLTYISVILGAVTLSAIILFILGQGSSGFYLGIGLGGMERFIIYPALLWILAFGAYLIGNSVETATTSKV